MRPQATTPARLYLTPGDAGRPLSLEEFESADGLEGHHYELIDGRLDVSPLPNLPHELLRKWLERRLDRYAEEYPEVVNYIQAPARVFVSGGANVTCPEPDIAVYRDFPLGLPPAEYRWQDFSPLVVAEVISPDTAAKDEVRNRALYLQVPTIQEYWMLDPRADPNQPSLVALRRGRGRWRRPVRVAFGGTYTTPLLPGFALVVRPTL